MKTSNTVWVIALIIFIFLGSMEIMLWKQYNKNMEERNAGTATVTDAGKKNILYAENHDAVTDTPADDAPDTHKYIFVGDSRYVAMSEYAQAYDVFFCENGVGLYFLKNRMDKIVEASDDNTRIIIGLGVNDAGAGNTGYIEAIMDLCGRTDAEVYYMLVNPVSDSACAANGYSLTNSMVDRFNTSMIEGLSDTEVKIIDTNTYLTSNGYNTFDGLHYDNETTEKIYNFIKLCIRNQ